jgi:hypothetical protein
LFGVELRNSKFVQGIVEEKFRKLNSVCDGTEKLTVFWAELRN